MALAGAMPSFNGKFYYGSSTFASAEEICEIEGIRIELNRDLMDATNRCVPGQKRWVAGELDIEISGDLIINKDACGRGMSGNGSIFDVLAEYMIENETIPHVWFLDEYNDGFYVEAAYITQLSQTQNIGEVIKASFTLKPELGVNLVFCGTILP
jgi:hypothetical protein